MQFQMLAGGSDWRTILGVGGLLARYTVSSFRVLGDAAGSQTLLALLNQSTTRRLVVPRCHLWVDDTAAVTAAAGNIRVGRQVAAVLGGGTALAKALKDSRLSSDPLVTVLCAMSSDASGSTPITGVVAFSPAVGTLWGQVGLSKLQTAAGQRLVREQEVLSPVSPPVVNPGEALVVTFAGGAASNPATTQYCVTLDVEEYGG